MWEFENVKKAGVVLIQSYFPSDLVTGRWFYFHSPQLGNCMID
jgi:hypothetical protein